MKISWLERQKLIRTRKENKRILHNMKFTVVGKSEWLDDGGKIEIAAVVERRTNASYYRCLSSFITAADKFTIKYSKRERWVHGTRELK